MRQFCSCGFAGLRAVSSLRYFCAFWHFVVAFVVAMAARGEQMFQEEEDMFGTKKEHRNPLVLCGAIATAGVLLAGLVSFKQGNYNRSQMFMRARVGFQAATVALMVGTVALQDRSSVSD